MYEILGLYNDFYPGQDTSERYYMTRNKRVGTAIQTSGDYYRGSYYGTVEGLYDAYTHNAINGSYWMMRGQAIVEDFLLLSTL